MCDQCQALAAENAALRQRIVKLGREVKLLRARLKVIREFAERVLNKTQDILSQRSGVPRDKWHTARGMDNVASAVLKLIGW